MRFAWRAARVHNMYSLRLAMGNRQIGMSDSTEKSSILLLKAILVSFFFRTPRFTLKIAPPRPFDAEGHFVVQQNRQIGLQVATKYFVQLQHRLRAQFAAATLISFGGIGETIAEHDASFSKRGQNHFVNVLCSGGKHERHLGTWR